VALPMDEQRILDEMERMLAADDPRLAARLAAFGQPGFGQALRTRRARATLSVMVLVLIAAVAAVIYLMSVLRPNPPSGPEQPGRSASPGHSVSRPTGQRAAITHSGWSGLTGKRAASGSIAGCAATVPPPGCTSVNPPAG
jgi:DUF3040 family protein